MSPIDFDTYPINEVIPYLLKDKTTGENIIFATTEYAEVDSSIGVETPMSVILLYSTLAGMIKPRVEKSTEQRRKRTKSKAEVFTPSWICNKMNNYCDAEWFGRPDVFNVEVEKDWIPTTAHIQFEDIDGWKRYVDSTRLEITCGEAPYIVSRYDTSNGEPIAIPRRIGILDRKLRVINENVTDEAEWLTWVVRAYQSTYGYEFQGDNLLLARINLLLTCVEYMVDKWNRVPTSEELMPIVDIICWNIWQMDGLSGTIPFRTTQCKIFDWKQNTALEFNKLKEESE